MKSANEDSYTCSIFQQNISAFIDDDLPEIAKAEFVSHASRCKVCSSLLKDFYNIKTLLRNLNTITVSPEFDFRLKSNIRLENIRLQSPLYRFKLFIQENVKMLVTVPAMAIIILVVLFSRVQVNHNQNIQPEIAENTISTTDSNVVLPVDDSTEEIIHYVLDSVKQSEAELGIFLNEQNSLTPVSSTDPNIKQISF